MSDGWADGFALLPMPLVCENSAVSLLKRGGRMDQAEFARIVENVAMALSVHNAQPARWRLVDGQIWVAHDLIVQLPHADPAGDGIGLSCGAAVEATCLALSAAGYGSQVQDVWRHDDQTTWPGHRMVAVITLETGGKIDPLAQQLEQRFTWRGAFGGDVPMLYGWTRADTVLVMDMPQRTWLGTLNDSASLRILAQHGFRHELLSWMRLSDDHPRVRYDGMARRAAGMKPAQARSFCWGFGALWPWLHLLGRTSRMTPQSDVTLIAPILACFHRPKTESPVTSGCAYLRFWLEATSLGLAGWPMAGLTDDADARSEICAHHSIPQDHKLIQVIRLGQPTGPRPPQARRPLSELIP